MSFNTILRRSFTSYSSIKFTKVCTTLITLERQVLNARRKYPGRKKKLDVFIKKGLVDEKMCLRLSELLNIQCVEAFTIMERYPQLKDENFMNKVEQRISYLEEKKVDRVRVNKSIWLLFKDREHLQKRTEAIATSLNLDFETAISFVSIANLNWVEKTKKLWESEKLSEEEFTRPGSLYRNRVDCIADRLQCQPWVISDLMAVYNVLVDDPFYKVRAIFRLLLDDAGFTPHHIISNPSVLRRDTQLIQKRLKLLQESFGQPGSQKMIKPISEVPISLLCKNDVSFNSYISQIVESRPIIEAEKW